MDTSEIYQKMCDCEEVQEHWRKFAVDTSQDDLVWGNQSQRNYCRIWLPRQDQIQEMMQDVDNDFVLLNHKFQFMWERHAQEIGKVCVAYMWHQCFGTAEQLWLAFYMYEKHSKVWTGEKWIKAGGE